MNSVVRIPLTATAEQTARLKALQGLFAEACNALGRLVQETHTWNRVALHHMAYKQMRERFPALGSQMVCNAIYSVSRAARQVYQAPTSPFRLQKLGDRPLPLLHFTEGAPVFFDRHTLSLKDGRISMFTLDGRMHFSFGLPPEVEQRFLGEKLREILLAQRVGGYELAFVFDPAAEEAAATPPHPDRPEYVLVLQDGAAPAPPPLHRPPAATPTAHEPCPQ